MKFGFITIGLLLACTSVHAQDVSQYTPGQMPEGVVYFLPKTMIQVNVTTVQTNYSPGELCLYADRYLHAKPKSSSAETSWEIKNIEVKVIGVPDQEKAYAVKLKDKSAASNVELTEDGIVKAINTTYPGDEVPAKPKPEAAKPKTDIRSLLTQEMLMAGSTAKLAELVAQEIYNIRESKNSLVRGQADYMPQDGTALRLMLDNLDAQEAAFTSMFIGNFERKTIVSSFVVEPKGDINNEMIFRFSEKLGVLSTDNLAGQSFVVTVKSLDALPPADEQAKAKKKKPEGIIYNIPGKALVTLSSMSKTYFEGELPITQFGETETLVDNLFNSKVSTRVIFNPTTGAISKIEKD